MIDLTLSSEAGKLGPLKLALDPFYGGRVRCYRLGSGAERLASGAQSSLNNRSAGDVDFFKFDAKAGDEIGIHMIASASSLKLAGGWPEPLPASAVSTFLASDPPIARARRGPVAQRNRGLPLAT